MKLKDGFFTIKNPSKKYYFNDENLDLTKKYIANSQ